MNTNDESFYRFSNELNKVFSDFMKDLGLANNEDKPSIDEVGIDTRKAKVDLERLKNIAQNVLPLANDLPSRNKVQELFNTTRDFYDLAESFVQEVLVSVTGSESYEFEIVGICRGCFAKFEDIEITAEWSPIGAHTEMSTKITFPMVVLWDARERQFYHRQIVDELKAHGE